MPDQDAESLRAALEAEARRRFGGERAAALAPDLAALAADLAVVAAAAPAETEPGFLMATE